MGSWLDKLARSSAAESEVVGDEAAGITRRDALRRAGVIGAAVVAVPMMDSVLAPAFATTSGPGGGTCTKPSDGSAMCGGSAGCPRCQKGQRCKVDTDCISGICVEPTSGKRASNGGVCGPSNTGEQCYESADCAAGLTCTGFSKKHVGTCQPTGGGGGGGGGSACTSNKDCGSGKICQNGVCVTKPPKK